VIWGRISLIFIYAYPIKKELLVMILLPNTNVTKNMKRTYNITVPIFLLWVILFSAISCKPKETPLDAVIVRLASDPDRLHPVIARSSISYQIMNKIFQPLADFDPNTLNMVPILLNQLPTLTPIEEGTYAGFYSMNMQLIPGAQWEDGKSVTTTDVEFSLKSILICEWYGSGAPGLLSTMVDMNIIDDQNMTFIVKDKSIFGAYNMLLVPILPKHIYDPENQSQSLDLGEALNGGSPEWIENNPDLKAFAESFNSVTYSREIVSGSGPYGFRSWEDGQLIILDKKSNYWGNAYATDRPYLTGDPSTILYRIIPDEVAAIEALKNGDIDILGDFSPDQFSQLMADSSLMTYNPDVLQYYYTAINNRDPRLADRAVRQALAHALPTEEIIEKLFAGLASRITGPIHPAKYYYNHTLSPVTYDLSRARQLLDQAGWIDSNNNGIRDKEVDGQRQELAFKIITSQRKLGQDLSLVFQEEAAKIGIQIEIVVLDNPTLLKDVTERNFDLANLASRFNPGLDELYSNWHTQSATAPGNNISGFSDAAVDSLILRIQTGTNTNESFVQLYGAFQQIIAEEQPVIFICAPKERIAARKHIDLPTTLMKPGYLEQKAKPAGRVQ
jgi:peptide/nickel transport system substrate-binding protein